MNSNFALTTLEIIFWLDILILTVSWSQPNFKEIKDSGCVCLAPAAILPVIKKGHY